MYTALLTVCIKANELDLALDVFAQLLEEGCTPNLVTYNILIDVRTPRSSPPLLLTVPISKSLAVVVTPRLLCMILLQKSVPYVQNKFWRQTCSLSRNRATIQYPHTHCYCAFTTITLEAIS